jgi:hypothetical protein
MTNPTRITVAFDQSTAKLLEKLTQDMELSQSEIMRRALRFYYENQAVLDPATKKKVHTYMDLLLSAEHVILDIDHWLLFLRLIETSPKQEKFWAEHKEVARSHGAQLKSKVHSAEELLERLEICNFYRMTKNSDNDFTLVFGSEFAKKFTKLFLVEFFFRGRVQGRD